ncbi:MAG: hypothetical protein ACLR7Z_17135 [Bilophila wadsworthia]
MEHFDGVQAAEPTPRMTLTRPALSSLMTRPECSTSMLPAATELDEAVHGEPVWRTP